MKCSYELGITMNSSITVYTTCKMMYILYYTVYEKVQTFLENKTRKN